MQTSTGSTKESSGMPPQQDRDDDSGLHDIRSMASSAKMRISSKRITTNPPVDDDILALCLRQKFNPERGEVWVGDTPKVAEWGRKLAELKDKKTIPVYFSPRNRTFFEFRGHHLVTGDTDDAAELAKRKGPVPLSRIVFIKPVVQNEPLR